MKQDESKKYINCQDITIIRGINATCLIANKIFSSVNIDYGMIIV